jgi:hypothetical protein
MSAKKNHCLKYRNNKILKTLQRKDCNYGNHAIREQELIVQKLSTCKPFTNVTYWGRTVVQWHKSSVRAGSQVTFPATHSLNKSDSKKFKIHNPSRVSPTIFDTIHFVFKIILLRYLTQCFYCRPNNIYSHATELTTPMYFNWLFNNYNFSMLK